MSGFKLEKNGNNRWLIKRVKDLPVPEVTNYARLVLTKHRKSCSFELEPVPVSFEDVTTNHGEFWAWLEEHLNSVLGK